MFRQGLDYFVPQDDAHKDFDERITIEAREAVGGPEYDPQAVVGSALIHRVTGKPDTGRKCMIYFHGGGGVAGTAEQMKSIVNRFCLSVTFFVLCALPFSLSFSSSFLCV